MPWNSVAGAAVVLSILLSVGFRSLASAQAAQPTPPAATQAATEPAPPDAVGNAADNPTTAPSRWVPLTREQKRDRLVAYIRGEYSKMLRNRDWITRSYGVLGISKLPGTGANDPLLGALLNDKHEVVRMIAWQALLARAAEMSEEEIRQWTRGSYSLIDAGAFRGDLRLALIRFLATQPPDKKTRAIFMRLFDESNQYLPEDRKTIDALGTLLLTWKSPEIVEHLIERMTKLDDAWRAEAVFRAMGASGPAGAGIQPADKIRAKGSDVMWQTTQPLYAAWWKGVKSDWQKASGGGLASVKALTAQHIAAPIPLDQIDPYDVRWHRELELTWPKIRSFDLAFALDVTASMQEAIDWLRRDVKRMLKALMMVSGEPRIGITLFRDHGDEFVTKIEPLTDKGDVLVNALATTPAKGGGDIPEAVLEGLNDCIKGSRWNSNPSSPKIIVLVGDAPPHPNAEEACVKLAAAAAEKNFRIYALKLKTRYSSSDLEIFDKISEAGKGSSFAAGAGNQSTTKLLSSILLDMVNPEYRDRVEPWIHIVLEMAAEPVPEAHKPFPAYAPSPSRGPYKKVDPQANR